jgi:hypothetical protein
MTPNQMNLHPDVLTDLVMLYHAGEASQASREFLEKEALRNRPSAAISILEPLTSRGSGTIIGKREYQSRARQWPARVYGQCPRRS